MKNDNWYFNRKYIASSCTSFCVLLLCCAFCNGQTSNDNSTTPFKNNKYYFSVNLPNDWKTSEVSDPNSDLRISSKSPNDSQTIFVYAFKEKENVDLFKFAETDNKMFKNLGLLTGTNKMRNYLLDVNKIEKSYLLKTRKTKLLFHSKGNFGYVLMWQSLEKDTSAYLKISRSFKDNVPAYTTIIQNFRNRFYQLGNSALGIVFILIAIAICYPIGKSGQLFRKGIVTKKALNKIRKETSQKGLVINEKWHSYNKKSIRWIVLPALGWGIFYGIVFVIFSTKTAIISLLALIPIFLGYFGIFFVPSKEPDDYIAD